MRKQEKYAAPGKLVDVNNHKMHVFSCGDGEKQLVFMSGSGTCCPTLDFKPLWEKLSDKYRIIVVEKAGYGWSEPANTPRDIDTVLEETRAALQRSGESPPYILCPHSMSGLEAIYWAQKYPSEVDAIIGLDAATPEAYDFIKIPSKAVLRAVSFLISIGIHKPFSGMICNQLDVIKNECISETDVKIYKYIFRKSTFTPDMIEEGSTVLSNAAIVKESGIPVNTPACFFVSDGKQVKLKNWREIASQYIANIKNGKCVFLDCGHYIHAYESERIADAVHEFINSTILTNHNG